jgi:hypothetical protein
MTKTKVENKQVRNFPEPEELAGSTPIGKHYYCGGDVYFVPQESMGYRYCVGCKMTNHKDGILSLVREAAFWK